MNLHIATPGLLSQPLVRAQRENSRAQRCNIRAEGARGVLRKPSRSTAFSQGTENWDKVPEFLFWDPCDAEVAELRFKGKNILLEKYKGVCF